MEAHDGTSNPSVPREVSTAHAIGFQLRHVVEIHEVACSAIALP